MRGTGRLVIPRVLGRELASSTHRLGRWVLSSTALDVRVVVV